MKLKKLMIIDGNPFADTEFGQLECVEVNGKLYFPASECAKGFSDITIREKLS